MTALLLRTFRGAVTASRWAVAGPMLFIALLVYLVIGTAIAFVLGSLLDVVLRASAETTIRGTIWEWLLAIPLRHRLDHGNPALGAEDRG